MATVNPTITPAISRRPFGLWAAMVVLMIFASSTLSLWLATELADWV
jgi:hypothetical protein